MRIMNSICTKFANAFALLESLYVEVSSCLASCCGVKEACMYSLSFPFCFSN